MQDKAEAFPCKQFVLKETFEFEIPHRLIFIDVNTFRRENALDKLNEKDLLAAYPI